MTFPDSITKSCPIIYSGNLVILNLDPTISVNGNLNKCKKDTVTLIGNVSSYFNNVEVFYNWQKFDSILFVWEPILPLSKVNTLIINDAGRYRLEVIAHVKNNFQNDTFTNDFCKMTFLSNEINISDKSNPSYPSINTIYKGSCVGDSIVYYLTNKNATYSYQWIDKLGNIFNSDTFRTVLSDKIDTVINRNIGECVYDRNIKILKGHIQLTYLLQ
ncbi:MAG: hypothetical protein IPL95_12815 [Saprospiraceae bacterium]|nr:hypothetical protein [Saprospiraceae bacterium]